MSETLTVRPAVESYTPEAVARCANCGADATGPFCAQCGQRAQPPRLTLRALANEVFAQVAQLDHGLLYTFVNLVRRPGVMIRDYIGGRRRVYTSPVSYVVLAIGFSALRSQWHSTTPSPKGAKPEVISPTLSPAVNAKIVGIFTFLWDHPLLFLAVAALPAVILMRGLFDNRKFNVAEIAAFACYSFATAVFLRLVMVLPFDLLHGHPPRMVALAILAYPLWPALDYFGRSFDTLWRFAVSVIGGIFGALILLILVLQTFY